MLLLAHTTDGFHRTLFRFKEHEFAFTHFVAVVSGATLLVGASTPGPVFGWHELYAAGLVLWRGADFASLDFKSAGT